MWCVEGLSARTVIDEAGLLAEGGRKYDRSVLASHPDHLAKDSVHAAVAMAYSIAVGLLVLGAGLQIKASRLKVAPVHMLKMCRAVKEQRRKRRVEFSVVMTEHIELQSVENRCAAPTC